MGQLKLLAKTIWNSDSANALSEKIRAERPAVVHFHNTFPLMSPAVYDAAHRGGAAVVQTLHNYRLVCPGALLMRDSVACEQCLGKTLPLAAIKHKCYRGNRGATAAVVALTASHRILGTWRRAVDVYIAPSAFAAKKLAEGGLPADKIVVKPNFVYPDPPLGKGGGGYAAFVGRLSPEKGVEMLLAAWDVVLAKLGSGETSPRLRIVGDGPLADAVRSAAARNPLIEWLRRRPLSEVYSILGAADVAITPSICYETFGRVAAEAFACGTPVIASAQGAFAEIVEHGRTGYLFKPADPNDLAAKVAAMWADPAAREQMRPRVRVEYETKYTGTRNGEMLEQIYGRAIEKANFPLAA
jgi:glycosyltransferase involved in cell wall biosynthesis